VIDGERARALITAYVEGWRAGDADRVLSTLTSDCLVIESHGPTYRGAGLVREWLTSWFADGGGIPRWDITSVVRDGDSAAFEWVFTATGSWGEATFDGATVVRFRDDRICYLREYRCTEPPYDWHPDGG
jgi:ketosteroid isomerase-like protein